MSRTAHYFDNDIVTLWMDFWLALPVALIVAIYGYSERPLHYFLLMLISSYIAGLAARRITRENRRYYAVILCAVWNLIAAYLFSKDKLAGGLILLWLYNFGVSFRGMVVAEQPERNRKNSTVYYFSGLMVYFFAYFVYLVVPVFEDFLPHITAGGLIASASALFIVNRDVLILAGRSGLSHYGTLTAVKRNNRLIACAVFMLTAAIAGFNVLKTGIKSAIRSMFSFVLGLVSSLFSPIRHMPPGEGGDLPKPDLPPAGNYVSGIWDLIVTVLSIILFAVAAVLLARLLVRMCKVYLPRLKGFIMDLLRGNAVMDRVDYRDEKESLLDFNSLLGNTIKGIKKVFDPRKFREPSWEALQNNRERVRFIYRYVVKRAEKEGFVPKASRTPGETIGDLAHLGIIDSNFSENLSVAYGMARYGTGDISDRDAEKLRKQFYNDIGGR